MTIHNEITVIARFVVGFLGSGAVAAMAADRAQDAYRLAETITVIGQRPRVADQVQRAEPRRRVPVVTVD